MLACFFKSIWNAWPTPKENSEINSVALSESRVKFLDIMSSLWLITLTLLRPCSSGISVPRDTIRDSYLLIICFIEFLCSRLDRCRSEWRGNLPIKCQVETEIGFCWLGFPGGWVRCHGVGSGVVKAIISHVGARRGTGWTVCWCGMNGKGRMCDPIGSFLAFTFFRRSPACSVSVMRRS
jgi:hypothetical protein